MDVPHIQDEADKRFSDKYVVELRVRRRTPSTSSNSEYVVELRVRRRTPSDLQSREYNENMRPESTTRSWRSATEAMGSRQHAAIVETHTAVEQLIWIGRQQMWWCIISIGTGRTID